MDLKALGGAVGEVLADPGAEQEAEQGDSDQQQNEVVGHPDAHPGVGRDGAEVVAGCEKVAGEDVGVAEQADGAVAIAGLGAVVEGVGESLLGGVVAEGDEDQGVSGAIG